MTPEQYQLLQDVARRLDTLEYKINRLDRSNRYVFEKDIATLKGIKIGLYGVPPILQQAAITAPSGGAVIDVQARAAIALLILADKNVGITL